MAYEFDLVVASNQILTAGGWLRGQIGVRGGRIEALLAPDVSVTAGRLVDVGEKHVIPGLIDTHVHLRDPGYRYKETVEAGTRAAAAGGVTSIFDMPNVRPPTTTVERLRAHLSNAKAQAMVDFGHIASGVIPETIPDLAAGGASALKIWMMEDVGRDYPHAPGTAVTNHGVLYRCFEAAAETDIPLFIHPHDQHVYEVMVERARRDWGTDFRSYAKARHSGDGVVINSGVATALEFQRATRAHMHMLHLSTRAGIDMIRRAKAEGRRVTGEVNPNALFVGNTWENLEKRGPFILGAWVPEDDVEAIWEGVDDGTVDVFASDHGPHTKDEKEPGWEDMYATPGGSPSIEHYPRLLFDAVNQGRLTLEKVVELCATNPARLMGYDDRKGSIKIGADADLVVVDMEREETITAANSHYMCGWTNLEGVTVKGVPSMTILRGNVIMEDGNVTAEPGSGELLSPVPVEIEPRLLIEQQVS